MKRYGVLFSLIMVGSLVAMDDDPRVPLDDDIVLSEPGERITYTRSPEECAHLAELAEEKERICRLIKELSRDPWPKKPTSRVFN